MKIEIGYVYHIKEEYFEYVKDEKLMKNHEGKNTRPNYYCLKVDDSELLWFVPMSCQITKYEKVLQNKINKFGKCDTIIIGNYRGRKHAFLIQNMFPIIPKYIDHIDTINNKIQKVATQTRREIEIKVRKVFKLRKQGIDLIFPDVDKICNLLNAEIEDKK